MASKTAKPSVPMAKNFGNSNTETASLQFSLPQMLDLALGTPEVGTVNLNILHNFLHVLLHQVNLRATKVEYRGEDATRLQNVIMAARTGPSLHLHEYNIIESSGRVKQRIHSTEDVTVKVDVYTEEQKTSQGKTSKGGKPAASAPASARGKGAKEQVSEISLDAKSSTLGNGAKKTKGMKQQIGGGSESEAHSVIFVEPIIDGAVPSALGFKQLEDTIHKLQTDFRALEELASTPEMVERIKSNSTDPVTDMWHIINITKRLDAAENGIDKMTTMVQDLIKSDKVITLGGSERTSTISTPEDVNRKFNEIETRVGDLERQLAYGSAPGNGEAKMTVVDNKSSTKEGETPAYTGIVDSNVSNDIIALKAEMDQVRKEMIDLTGKIGNSDRKTSKKSATSVVKSGIENANGGETFLNSEPGVLDTSAIDAALEGNSKIMKQIHDIEVTCGNATQELLQRVQELERDVGCLMEKLNSAPMAGVGAEGSQGVGDLLNKIQTIQNDMENMNQTANRLLDDKETRETHTNALLEQIELLKTIKADKEDLEGALADKADARAVNRKVSYDQFDAACDDLSRGLEDAVSKLSQQEGIWQKALDDVQHEIEGKLDKIEISPLKEFVNNKLKTLQEKLKTLSEMRRESEAAGTKKLLRDVQCLSCDKNVVMKMQEGAVFHAEPMPCTRSMKPYLTYELDQVRKQQRRLPHGRNMIQFEAAMQEEARKPRTQKDVDSLAKSPRDHLCNRYCGGSHTVTTPQQRVMRMGHFLTQWGPEAIQLTEGVVRGKDGQMYRSRGLPNTNTEICAPQEGGDQQQQNVDVVIQNQEPRSMSVTSSRAGDPRESVARSSSNIKPSGSSASNRRSTPRRMTVIKPPVERPPSLISAPKVSEVILEESGERYNETGNRHENDEQEEAEEEGEEEVRIYRDDRQEIEPEEQNEEAVSSPEEPASTVEEVSSYSAAQQETG